MSLDPRLVAVGPSRAPSPPLPLAAEAPQAARVLEGGSRQASTRLCGFPRRGASPLLGAGAVPVLRVGGSELHGGGLPPHAVAVLPDLGVVTEAPPGGVSPLREACRVEAPREAGERIRGPLLGLRPPPWLRTSLVGVWGGPIHDGGLSTPLSFLFIVVVVDSLL